MKTKILPLNKFRRLKEFKQYFNITEDSVIAYNDTIYTNKTLPRDVVLHEMVHLDQQRRYGLKTFIDKYLNDKEFRLLMEKEAFTKQLASIEDEGLREAVRLDAIEALQSGLYGKVSKAEAEKILPKPKKLDVNQLVWC